MALQIELDGSGATNADLWLFRRRRQENKLSWPTTLTESVKCESSSARTRRRRQPHEQQSDIFGEDSWYRASERESASCRRRAFAMLKNCFPLLLLSTLQIHFFAHASRLIVKSGNNEGRVIKKFITRKISPCLPLNLWAPESFSPIFHPLPLSFAIFDSFQLFSKYLSLLPSLGNCNATGR